MNASIIIQDQSPCCHKLMPINLGIHQQMASLLTACTLRAAPTCPAHSAAVLVVAAVAAALRSLVEVVCHHSCFLGERNLDCYRRMESAQQGAERTYSGFAEV